MSQRVNEKQNPRAGVTSKQKVPEPKIMGLSPDDGVGVTSEPTGKPGGSSDPTGTPGSPPDPTGQPACG